MKAVLYIIILLSYIFAPREYSWSFCVCMLAIFCFIFLKIIVKTRNYKIFSYATLFFATLFFVNFAYPVFIYPTDPTFILQFRYSFSPEYINRGTVLCVVAFAAFAEGFSRDRKIIHGREYSININAYNFFLALACLVFLYNVYIIYPQIGTVIYGDAKLPFQGGALLNLLLCVLLTINSYRNGRSIYDHPLHFLKVNWFILLLAALYSILILMLGSREYALTLFLLVAFVFSNFVRPIRLKTLLPLLLIGVISMYYVSQIRNASGETYASSGLLKNRDYQDSRVSGYWNMFTDLMVNNRNLYVGMQYVDDDNRGYTYGYHYIPTLFAPVPFLPDFVSRTFLGEPAVKFTSQEMLTDYTRTDLGHSDLDYELGSNCVVDVYMAFGVIGVIVLFGLLGYGIRFLEQNSPGNIKYACLYIILFTSVVFFCRGSFFGFYRNLIWAYLICSVILRVNRRSVSI